MRKLSKKASLTLGEVPTAVITLVVLALMIAIGATILATGQPNQCSGLASGTVGNYYAYNASGSACNLLNATGTRLDYYNGGVAYNASGFGLSGMQTFGQWIPTLAIVLAASVVVGLVFAYLLMKRND